jgi:hypothetical protein
MNEWGPAHRKDNQPSRLGRVERTVIQSQARSDGADEITCKEFCCSTGGPIVGSRYF